MRLVLILTTLLVLAVTVAARAETAAEQQARAFKAQDLLDRSMDADVDQARALIEESIPLLRQAFLHRDWETLGTLQFLEALPPGFQADPIRHAYEDTLVKPVHMLVLEAHPQVLAGMREWIANPDFSVAVSARDIFRQVILPADIEVLSEAFKKIRGTFDKDRADSIIDDYHVHLEENLADCSWANFKFAIEHANADIREVAQSAARYRNEPEVFEYAYRLFARGDLDSVRRAYDMIEFKDVQQSYDLALRGLNALDPAIVKETRDFLGKFHESSRMRGLVGRFQDCNAALTGPRKLN